MKKGKKKKKKKDGTIYYRSSITFQNKHISLGSFEKEDLAASAYLEAEKILRTHVLTLERFDSSCVLSFSKWVCLLNFRDNHIYIKTPIYLKSNFFYYYFSTNDYYIFDIDDLFYYSTHSIMRRGGHLFVSDYGMQVNILNRYGIKNYAVVGRDYHFVNGNTRDFRYENIEIVNRYHGVFYKYYKGKMVYETRIHIKGEYIVGRYDSEIEAAVAYNKAASTLLKKGYERNYPVNYLETLYGDEYKNLLKSVSISKTIRELPEYIKSDK